MEVVEFLSFTQRSPKLDPNAFSFYIRAYKLHRDENQEPGWMQRGRERSQKKVNEI